MDRMITIPLQTPIEKRAASFLSRRRWFRFILLPYLLTRLLLLVTGYVTWIFVSSHFAGASYLPVHPDLSTLSWQMWRWFDSYWYLGIVEHGYASGSALHTPTNWVFYPFYPLCMDLLGKALGGNEDAYTAAGLIISNISALVALTYLYLMVERDFGVRIAKRSVLYLLVFPMAFYLSAVYTESLWLALAISSLYYGSRQKWALAGILGALAAFTRPQGIALILPLLWEFWQVVSDREKPLFVVLGWQHAWTWWTSRIVGLLLATKRFKNWLSLVCICCVPLGTVAFFTYAYFKTGDFFAEIDTEKWGWARPTMPPWETVIQALQHPVGFSITDWNAWPSGMLAIALFTLLFFFMLRRLPGIYVVYAAVMILFPLGTGRIASVDRFYLVVFPAQVLLAIWSVKERRGWLHWSVVVICLLGECVGMACFVLGFPFIA